MHELTPAVGVQVGEYLGIDEVLLWRLHLAVPPPIFKPMHEAHLHAGPLLVFFNELWRITMELAPALLFGLLLAGLAHVWLPKRWVRRQLSRPTLGSAIRAVVLGVPLPLCSCGVVPTAIGLRRQGASEGAATAFLISTPQTGVDSILVSAAFLGWPFAIFKLVAAAVTGIVGGALVNVTGRGSDEAPGEGSGEVDVTEEPQSKSIVEAARYAVFDLLAVIDLWIVLGVVLAAVISVAVPEDFFANSGWSQGFVGMLLVLVVALPLYICTTSSVPIAASLIAAGMPLGSALVFLMAGPATNIATLGAVYRGLGGRVLAIYLGTVVVMSMGLGMTFDFVLADAVAPTLTHEHGGGLWSVAMAMVLIGLLVLLTVRRSVAWFRRRGAAAGADELNTGAGVTLAVTGMTCEHCVGRVKRTLEEMQGVEQADPNLGDGRVWVRGENLDAGVLVEAVSRAGYGASVAEPPSGGQS